MPGGGCGPSPRRIVHGDLKPSNIMVKRTGNAKIIDIGSAMDLDQASARRMWSPAYAAPEVLAGGKNTPQSDLASLGYVLIEMLAGQAVRGPDDYRSLLAAKKDLDKRLKSLLPDDVSCNEMLIHLCQKLIAPDPARPFLMRRPPTSTARAPPTSIGNSSR